MYKVHKIQSVFQCTVGIRLSRPYTLRRVCICGEGGDGDGRIDISEDKSNHLLIKPSTRGLPFTMGGHWTAVVTPYLYVLMRAL